MDRGGVVMRVLSSLAAARLLDGTYVVRWVCPTCGASGNWLSWQHLREQAEEGERHRREWHQERIAA